MAYVDYKCLESLLIEGEDLIATEGIGEKIKSSFNKVINVLKSFLKFMITMIKTIIMVIKNKIKTKAKSFKGELKLKTSDVSNITAEACNYAIALQKLINEVYGINGGTMNGDKIHEYVNKLKDRQESVITKANQLYHKYNGKEYSISASAAESLLRHLYLTQQGVEPTYDKVNKMTDMALNMSASGQDAETFSDMYSVINTFAVGIQKVSKALTQVNTIIINARYDYVEDQVTNPNDIAIKTIT